VIAIAGITPARVPELPGHGVAAISAVAADPAAAPAEFLRVLASRDEAGANEGVGSAR
jgi:thiamine-phosphate pyrophosphorylase